MCVTWGVQRERRRNPHKHWAHGMVSKRTMQREKNVKPRLSVENYKHGLQIQLLLLYHLAHLVQAAKRVADETRIARSNFSLSGRAHPPIKSAGRKTPRGESSPQLTVLSLYNCLASQCQWSFRTCQLCVASLGTSRPTAPSTDIERTRLLTLLRVQRKS